MAREPDPNCPICTVGSTFGIPGCLVLDFMQVDAARKRWQWADLGPGANDCPCIQDPPAEAQTQSSTPDNKDKPNA